MKKTELEIYNIRNILNEVLLLLEYRDSIERHESLKSKYPQFNVIERVILSQIIIKLATIIETGKSAKFNILKPINRITDVPEFANKLKHQQVKINEIKSKILMELNNSIAITVLDIRDWYIAHNDLHNRENRDIIPNEIRDFANSLLVFMNELGEILGLPTSRLILTDRNSSLENLFLDLEKINK